MLNTYIYIIGENNSQKVARGTKFAKIGVALNPERRLKTLQTGNPRPLEIYLTIGPMGNKEAFAVEKRLHRKFRKWHVSGEWFRKGLITQLGQIEGMAFNGSVTAHNTVSGIHGVIKRQGISNLNTKHGKGGRYEEHNRRMR